MLSKQHHLVVCGGFLFALCVLVGCGQRELPTKQTYPTQIRVLFKGEPVRYAIVEIDPVEGKGVPAISRTDADGVARMRTYGNDEPDGAVPGEYQLKVDPGNGVPPGYDAKKAEVKATDVPSASRQTTTPFVVEAKDNELEVTLPEG